ncbi:hypothetical protein BN971_03258 [Mycobacterium bohemicum DSM 44277]|uniref:Uncharacterized protein n=1 Tax=Mycobacterium bohemicum DSM 44277 TaxID=1236609 RepID=A0A0U0WCA8_MYCBE|nr:hypothetical protein BN971_03258 [Mycobacterium bohemicum DSM 44277]
MLSCCHTSDAATSEPEPGPEWISAELISGGSMPKSIMGYPTERPA